MVMRSQSKEKALANLTSKFMSDNDQPVNFPFAWMHCWSNERKFDYFSCILRPFVSSAYGCLEKNGRQIQASYSNLSRSHSTQVTYVMKTHQFKQPYATSAISFIKYYHTENPFHLNISEANKQGHSVLQRADPFHSPLTQWHRL